MKLTAEQIVKAKTAKSVEELITLAKAEGIEATEEEIKAQFNAMRKEGEIADEELSNVAGGGFFCDDPRPEEVNITTGKQSCPYCGGGIYRKENEDPYGDPYELHQCSSCGTYFRRYYEGDQWTKN